MTCVWCGRSYEPPHRRGPKPKYCRAACRQRAFESRRNVLEARLSASTLVAVGLLEADNMEAAVQILAGKVSR